MMMQPENATMAERLFISQTKLEAWVNDGKVTFEDNVLTILAEKAAYRLEPAAHITTLLDGQDTAKLVGQTWTIADLENLGAEYYRDSVILRDTAYQCEEGFVGTQQRRDPTPPPIQAHQPQTDVDLLADFLLKNL
jgi:hypothetical protein